MNQQEYAERMKDPHYKDLQITRHDNPEGKDYVFISYRGNSWKMVLSEIVYRLQTEYGLRIYFDKDFANETNVWVEQFQQNMDTSRCKAFLCFFDEGYVTSYATLLELMHAMNKKSNLSDKIYSINFPIDWDRLSDQDYDTGLGRADGDNPGWKREKEAFDKEFKLLKKKSGYEEIEEYYDPGQKTPLRACDCKNIMAVIQPKNQRQFAEEKDFYVQFIVNPLRAKTRTEEFPEGSVFERRPDLPPDGPSDGPSDPPPDDPPAGNKIPLRSFLKIFNHNNFKKSTFSKLKIIGLGECGKYSTGFYESAYDLVWSFVMGVLREKPNYIQEVNAKHSGMKNPVFLSDRDYQSRTAEEQRRYRRIELEGLEDWYMYRHFGQYGWMDTVLKIRIQDMGLSPDQFMIKYEDVDEEGEKIIEEFFKHSSSGKEKGTAGPVPDPGPLPLFEYELWGVCYTANSLAVMIHQSFDLMTKKYPEKAEEMADSGSITAVARKADVDNQLLPAAKMNYFQQKKEHVVNGKVYYVSNHYNREQGIGQIQKMAALCDGDGRGFAVTRMPAKETKKKNKKKGLGELIHDD